MKIGYDAKRLFHNTTGLGNFSRDLIQILNRYYPENEYHLFNPKPKKIDRLAIDNKTIFEHLPIQFVDKKLSSLWRSKKCIKDLKREGIDIFHGLSAEIPVGIEKTTIKSIVSIHDLIFLRYPQFYKKIDVAIYTKKTKNALKNADLIVAISEQTKQDIIHFFNTDPKKIKVIYQGCHKAFKERATLETVNQIKKKYQLPEKFILNVGTIESRKNLISIIEAIKETDISLVVIGRKTPYYEKVASLIDQEGLKNQVYFLQGLSIEELACVYQLATIFVYPSLFEGFGIPIIEALYSQTPVITSKDGCFNEAAGPHSIFIDPKNYIALKNNITKLWNTPKLCNQMASDGLNFVQKFNDDVIAKQWQKTYINLLNEK